VPTRKQRRRREKTFRHEYGFVTYDEEGNEVELDGSDLRAKKDKKEETSAKAKRGAGDSKRRSSTRRGGRDPAPPTWRRSARRGALWSPATVALSLIVFRSSAIPLRVVIGIVYAGLFIPLTYWMDGLVYRRHVKRSSGPAPRSGKSR
jgi:hypothetical protein